VRRHIYGFVSPVLKSTQLQNTDASQPELIFLYIHYDEHDNASLAMMERAADAWEHQSFKDTIIKATNVEIYYRALGFYLEEQPTLLTDLLQALTPRIDVNRVVRMFLKSDNIPLIKPFLLNVQSQNKREVNNALNDLLIEEEDYKTLRDSVQNNDNYDAMDLAQRLERHDLVFFRQIAANIYRKNKRWEKSIALSKQDKLFKDAIETAAMSGKTDVVEDLLRYVSYLYLETHAPANTSSSSSILAAANAMSACSMHATI
jgi:clathrin heavy chain